MPIIQHGHIDWGKSVKSLPVNGDLYTEVNRETGDREVYSLPRVVYDRSLVGT